MTTQPEALRLADALMTLFPSREDGERAAAELRRLHSREFANEVWQVKTQWVQDTAKPEELGMHRADVMRRRLERITAQRDALLEALKMAQFQIENQCDVGVDEWIACSKKVRAAIKAVEEQK